MRPKFKSYNLMRVLKELFLNIHSKYSQNSKYNTYGMVNKWDLIHKEIDKIDHNLRVFINDIYRIVERKV